VWHKCGAAVMYDNQQPNALIQLFKDDYIKFKLKGGFKNDQADISFSRK
jgi:hypothetical protein